MSPTLLDPVRRDAALYPADTATCFQGGEHGEPGYLALNACAA